ncbi:PAS domain-containing sensor histidine kinase [Elioraea sp.]|jgi:two-component system nitrogen regulation sensor histidine kinase NtrY|uniref:sensor histidine kinase NtrY-like n=2 Tax=Elioraea sp. TaxID=2185103 RepID=UPI0021DC5A15|nr:PAS domain-containing sensor histidine kinase [Elioraea sp.]GIX11164.1 MAG: PAS domain-containing sensor histidine kinase [Elioraea sp.]
MDGTAARPAAEAESAAAPRWRRIAGALAGGRLGRWLTIGLALASLAVGVATFGAITGSGALGLPPGSIIALVNTNLALLLVLGAVLAVRVVRVWAERRRGLAGARLHVRLVLLFGLVAVTPTIIVTVFSAVFFNRGLEAWFNERVRTALEESLSASQAYLREHEQALRGEALAMATDLNRAAPLLLTQGPLAFRLLVERQAAVRGLSEAVVFDGTSGRLVASGGLITPMAGEEMPAWAIAFARTGEVALLPTGESGRVRALVELDLPGDLFLLVGRPVDAQVLGHMLRTEQAVAQYRELERSREGLQVTFALVYAVVALLILFAAVLIGLVIAGQLARPISGLVFAAERARTGDLGVRVPERRSNDEIGVLARAFNRMIGQLEANRAELMDAYRQIDERRRFSESVLAGVSAGVIGLDAEGRIDLPNRSASELLGIDLLARLGYRLGEVVPEFAPLLDAAAQDPARPVQGEVKLGPPANRRTLILRISAEAAGGEVRGYVVTFDDVTALVAAQRQAAWADVARRIAHEIKNPLTPIQLSAERLRRKYLAEIASDPETFRTCTETIIRQVGDIGRMVDEFSAFARMPQPVLRPEDPGEIIRQAVFLQRNAHPAIAYAVDLPADPPRVSCDRRLIGQALTNLLANAADAVAARPGAGSIRVALEEGQGEIRIVVEDDGVGLPAEGREALTEPYVTRKTKGTGLGLAIVKKIMEDHAGRLVLSDRADGVPGARVVLVLPAAAAASPAMSEMPRMAHGA